MNEGRAARDDYNYRSSHSVRNENAMHYEWEGKKIIGKTLQLGKVGLR